MNLITRTVSASTVINLRKCPIYLREQKTRLVKICMSYLEKLSRLAVARNLLWHIPQENFVRCILYAAVLIEKFCEVKKSIFSDRINGIRIG